jgi:hypothetical protein
MKEITVRWLCALACLGLIGAPADAMAVVINFDVPADPTGDKPGNTYQAQGVVFSTLNSIPDAVDNVGETFTPSPFSSNFWFINNANAVSGCCFVAADDGGDRDLLMAFTTPVTSVQVATDDAGGEAPDVVRLLALRLLPGGDFEVLAVDSGFDDATTSPANLLSVSLGTPFSYVLFQTTSEQEGFDNLAFAPEPGSLALLGIALAGFGFSRRKLH